MLNSTTIARPHPEVASDVVDGEAVLLVPQRGTVVVLNEVGAAIWRQLDGVRTAGQIARLLAAEYDTTLAEAERDTLDFLADLVERGVVTLQT
jgi:hypothetical protein